MSSDKTSLNGISEILKRYMEDFHKGGQAVRDKKAALERDILNRYKMIVDVADKCRDKALISLDTVTATFNSQVQYFVSNLQKNMNKLKKLQKHIDVCFNGEEGARLPLTAQGISRDALECDKVVQNLMANNITTAPRPVLRFSASADVTLTTEQKFLGPVVKMDFAQKQAVNVKRMFCCLPSDAPIHVFSLFPREDDKVWVAYGMGHVSLTTDS